MNYEKLKAMLTQAEESNYTGNYDAADILANNLLAKIEHSGSLKENQAKNEIKALHCSALIALSTSKWRLSDYQTALTLAHASIDIAEEVNIPLLKAKALGNCGTVYANLSDNTTALFYYHKALTICEEVGDKAGIASNIGNIGRVYYSLSDYGNALEYYKKALALDEEINNKAGIAKNLTGIGAMYRNLLEFEQALTYYHKALALNEEIGNKNGIATNLSNIGTAYTEIADYAQALTHLHRALTINEETGNKAGIATTLSTIGNVYGYLSDYPHALTYMQKALAINEEIGDKSGIAITLGNIGNVYNLLSDNDRALMYYQRALAINEEIGNKNSYGINLGNIGSVHRDNGNYELAQEYFLKALHLSEEIGAEYPKLHWQLALGNLYAEQKQLSQDSAAAEKYLKLAIDNGTLLGARHIARDAYHSCYLLYKVQKHWKEALEMKELHEKLKDEINVEEIKEQEAIREQQKAIELAKTAADARHQATEQLLHNVLPPSIAGKMLDGTKLIAEKLPSVSVLFADIAGFTKLSQRITPEELVDGLDRIFSAFDALAEKHGLEKIKTIGDAYMVVAGAPVPRADHAEAMAQFALEMLEEMKQFTSISTGGEIQLRIGIHSGEVVAGVIGKKKFAYDLWGDAVNTASRMESHGEANRIHISNDFYRHLQNRIAMTKNTSHGLTFEERGEMEIKGKGMMKTYFLKKNV
ncbi:MAG: tetratricopeptide repeat protein [Bacteroidetes bacterium]|nr:tetratricopeptide repeat protein [Bacteroidota bacterium]